MSEKLIPQQLVSQQLSQLTQLETLLDTEKDVLQRQNPDALIHLTAEKNDLLLAIQNIDNAIGKSFEFKQEKLAGKFTNLLSDIAATLMRCKKRTKLMA